MGVYNKYIGETLEQNGASVPLESENVCFFGGFALTAESNYDAEPITWWTFLQRATKYVELAVYIHI